MNSYEFWNSTKLWPLTPLRDEVVFLATAMHQIGRASYPEWHGREPWLPSGLTPLPERQADALLGDLQAAHHVLAIYREGVTVRPLTAWEIIDNQTNAAIAARFNHADVDFLSEDDWHLARQRMQEIIELTSASAQRFEELLHVTFALLKTANLETVLRPVQGGDYEAAPSNLWNTELVHVLARFRHCQVDMRAPFDQRSLEMNLPRAADGRAHDFRWIFVTQPSLSNSIARIAAARGGNAAAPALAPSVTQAATKSGRGRRPGTGFDDTAALAAVRTLINEGMGKREAVLQIIAEMGAKLRGASDNAREKRLLGKLNGDSQK